MFNFLAGIPLLKRPDGKPTIAIKGVCCGTYLADIAAALRSDGPLVVEVTNVCFRIRSEFEQTFGAENFHSRQLVRLVEQMHKCEGRRAQIDAVFRITELLNAVDLLNKHGPIAHPTSRVPVFLPSTF